MEPLKLPNFHHLELFLLILIPFISIIIILPKRQKNKINFNDPYDLTKHLQRLNSPKAKEILEKLQDYKYRPNRQKLPKELIKEAKELLKKKAFR